MKIICDVCEAELEVVKTEYYDVIKVKPCEKCMDEARDAGYDAGYQDSQAEERV